MSETDAHKDDEQLDVAQDEEMMHDEVSTPPKHGVSRNPLFAEKKPMGRAAKDRKEE